MNAWKIPFVISIQTSGENHLKTGSSRRLKHPVLYTLAHALQGILSILFSVKSKSSVSASFLVCVSVF
jgi:hypothetical protein